MIDCLSCFWDQLVLSRSCLSDDSLGRVKDERAHSEIPAPRGSLSFYFFFFLLL